MCTYGDCTHCFEGFYLNIVSNACNSVFGNSDEVCDDCTELRYDGCF